MYFKKNFSVKTTVPPKIRVSSSDLNVRSIYQKMK